MLLLTCRGRYLAGGVTRVVSVVGQGSAQRCAQSCAPAESQQVSVSSSRCNLILQKLLYTISLIPYVLQCCLCLKNKLNFSFISGLFCFFQKHLGSCCLTACREFRKKKRLLTTRTFNCCLITAAWHSAYFEMMLLNFSSLQLFLKWFFFLFPKQTQTILPFYLAVILSNPHSDLCHLGLPRLVLLVFTSGLFLTFSHQQPQPSQTSDSSNVTFGLKTFFGFFH